MADTDCFAIAGTSPAVLSKTTPTPRKSARFFWFALDARNDKNPVELAEGEELVEDELKLPAQTSFFRSPTKSRMERGTNSPAIQGQPRIGNAEQFLGPTLLVSKVLV